MSTIGKFLRVGTHVLNLSKINYIWFDDRDGGAAFVDFGGHNSEGWDLVLSGPSAKALKMHFDREDDTTPWDK